MALDHDIYKIWFARNYKAHELNTVLLDNGLATMGAGVGNLLSLFGHRRILYRKGRTLRKPRQGR